MYLFINAYLFFNLRCVSFPWSVSLVVCGCELLFVEGGSIGTSVESQDFFSTEVGTLFWVLNDGLLTLGDSAFKLVAFLSFVNLQTQHIIEALEIKKTVKILITYIKVICTTGNKQ